MTEQMVGFELIKTFALTVPPDYDHDTQLTKFRQQHRRRFSYFNDEITDKKLGSVSHQLTPGQTYSIDLCRITRTVSSPECLDFLKARQAMLVGAQGLSVAWQRNRQEFPRGKWLVSFDGQIVAIGGIFKSRLSKSDYHSEGESWCLDLGCLKFDWNTNDCLFCVREKE